MSESTPKPSPPSRSKLSPSRTISLLKRSLSVLSRLATCRWPTEERLWLARSEAWRVFGSDLVSGSSRHPHCLIVIRLTVCILAVCFRALVLGNHSGNPCVFHFLGERAPADLTRSSLNPYRSLRVPELVPASLRVFSRARSMSPTSPCSLLRRHSAVSLCPLLSR
jgi:hypothetical protein